jgi:hypothetical protein
MGLRWEGNVEKTHKEKDPTLDTQARRAIERKAQI